MVRHPRQPSRECKGLHSLEDVLKREEELEEEAAVEVHRAGDVTEQDQPHLAALAPAELQIDQVPAAQVGAQCPPQVDTPSPRDGPPATAETTNQASRNLYGEPIDLVELVRRERREVAPGQRLLVRDRGNTERLVAVRLFLGSPGFECQGLALLGAAAETRVLLTVPRRLNQSGKADIDLALLTPEEVEATIERRKLLGPAHEHRAQPTTQLVAIADVEHFERAHPIGGLGDRDGQALASQERRKADHCAPEGARRHGYGWAGTNGVRPARATSARKRLMSSASFSTQPSVSATRASSRWSACNAASA